MEIIKSDQETSEKGDKLFLQDFREYPLSIDILAKIPASEITQFFKTKNVAITCFDVVNFYYLFGTDNGCSYFYNQAKNDLIKITSKKKDEIVTAVKLYSGIETQIGIATSLGCIRIFSFGIELKKYDLGSVHDCEITFLHWSLNGMHLFSGDKTGNVYDTSIEFEKDSCNVSFVHNFEHEIVQLEYRHKVLLVSTMEKSALIQCDTNDVILLGSKPTRLGLYGSCFNSDTIIADDLEVFATRPGCRLWRASLTGSVISTFLLRDQAFENTNSIAMLDECLGDIPENTEIQFGKIFMYRKNTLVTFKDRNVFFINVPNQRITHCHKHGCDIIDMSVTQREVFFLCRNRKLHRLSDTEDFLLTKASSATLTSATERNLQNVKDTLDEVKHNISPLVDSIQLGFSSSIHSAGKFSNKLQEKAKIFQSKFSVIKTESSKTEEVGMNDLHKENNGDSTEFSENIQNNTQPPTDETKTSQSGVDVNMPSTSTIEISSHNNVENKEMRASSHNISPTSEIVHKTVRRKRAKSNVKSHVAAKHRENAGNREMDSGIDICMNIVEDKIENFYENNKVAEYFNNTKELIDKNGGKNGIIPLTFQVNNLKLSTNCQEESAITKIAEKNATTAVVDDSTSKESSPTECPDAFKKLEEIVVSVQKSSGNKILPEIVLSPVKVKTEFNFTSESSTADENIDIASNVVHPAHCPIFKNEMLLETELSNDKMSEEPNEDRGNTFSDGENDNGLSFDNDETEESQLIDIYACATSLEDNSLKDNIITHEKVRDPIFSMSSSEDEASENGSDFCSFQDVTTEVSVRVSDTWSFITTSHDVATFGGASNLVWFTDSWDQIYITEDKMFQNNFKTVWKRLTKKAKQFAISPSGDLAAALSRSGKLYTASVMHDFIAQSEIVNFNWHHIDSEISFVAFEINYLIAITTHGTCKIKYGLTRSNLNGNNWTDLFVPEKVREVAVIRCGVIWVLTVTGNILTSGDKGSTWDEVSQPQSSYATSAVIQHIASDGVDVIFGCDDIGCIWFRTGINKQSPSGSQWWQITVTQYISNDETNLPFHVSPAVAHTITKVNHAFAPKIKVQHFAVTFASIWLPTDKRRIYIARGQVTGNHWKCVKFLGIAESASSWQHVTTSSIFQPENNEWANLIWVSRTMNNEIFCINTQTYNESYPIVLPPLPHSKDAIVKISACRTSLWVLLANGKLVARSGITASCLQGTFWSDVDIESQLESTHLEDVACCNNNVWVLTSTGCVYFRSGVELQNHADLTPAWLSIDACPNKNSFFTKIACSPSDMQVYAIDNIGCVYARSGLSLDFPIGASWEEMPGADAIEICVSNHGMYVLRRSGNILQRSGITSNNCVGNYWKKFKTRFQKIAVTPSNELWAIDNSCKLHHLVTHPYCPSLLQAVQENVIPSQKVSNDWEIL